MLQPFIWMFKTEGFKKHFLYLLFIYIKFLIPAGICFYIAYNFSAMPILTIAAYILAILLFAAPAFCVQGYFWELTQNIISRKWDIKAASVYNGRIKEIYSIELPEIKTLRFVWRGIASVVATTMMILPYAFLVLSTAFTGIFKLPMLNIDSFHALYAASYNLLYLFFFSFLPALLWNYAKQDSVFAVWNIRRAVYIMGNYTGKYIWNTVLFIVFYAAETAFLTGLLYLFGINGFQNITNNPVIFVLFITLAYIQYLYGLFVYAYLLGTITPPAEG